LSIEQRQDYIDAVLCMQNAPSRYGNEVPGAQSRFDDFVATHSIQTDYIHGTTNFLTWHRYFLHGWEQALKSECGYQGAMPYWNWDRYADDLFNSPLFNGDATSLGGNSVNGGCVQDGPFAE
jgi:tyrosinase